MTQKPVELYDLAQKVERFVDKQFADAARYDNSEPLDDSGVYLLHELVAEAYAQGWEQGFLVRDSNRRASNNRVKESSGG